MIAAVAWIVLTLLPLIVKDAEAKVDKKKLTLAVFLSGVYTTSSELPAAGQPLLAGVEMALELLNNDSHLLPGYTVEASITDVQVNIYI